MEATLLADAASAGLDAQNYLIGLISNPASEYGEWTQEDLNAVTRDAFERFEAENGPEEGDSA